MYRLQVTARSTLGALALHTGAVMVDHGWLRLLGGGTRLLSDLATVNGLDDPSDESTGPGLLVVAFDVMGGRFAINGGALPGADGEVCYWGPDTLDWLSLGVGHSAFMHWCLGDGIDEFYADLRWPGWQDEVSRVGENQGMSVFPPVCAAESRPIESATRRAVPWAELSALLEELALLPQGARFRVTTTE